MQTVRAASLPEIEAASERLRDFVTTTPLVPCNTAPQGTELFLKLENLQAIGSFKIRPIGNAVLSRPPAARAAGWYTLSSGNSALALAWMAKRLGSSATAVVAEGAPQAKLQRLRALDARIVEIPFTVWWEAMTVSRYAGASGEYVDAVRDPAALAGDATIGMEILRENRKLDAIFVPLGGGALACGIACAARALQLPVKVIACELKTAQPLTAALRAGRIVETSCDPGFISGIGFHTLLPEMWPLCREFLGSLTVSIAEVAGAIRHLAEHHKVIAEGAGAIAVAAALSGRHRYRRVCAVVSGGNLGNDMLATILAGGIPP